MVETLILFTMLLFLFGLLHKRVEEHDKQTGKYHFNRGRYDRN